MASIGASKKYKFSGLPTEKEKPNPLVEFGSIFFKVPRLPYFS